MKVSGLLLDVDSSPGKVKTIELEEENLSEFYDALNCNTIDIVRRKIGDRVFNIVCDDEGYLRESNTVSASSKSGRVMFVGNIFICNNYKDHLTSLSKDDVDYIANHIAIASFVTYKRKKIHTHPILIDVDYV